jgi:hypothetical protein
MKNEERTSLRLYSLQEIFNKLEEVFKWKSVKLNIFVLRNMVESYYLDIDRTKAFHGIKYADKHKKAALTIKWISKLRPIQLLSDDSKDISGDVFLSNALFAINAGLSFLEIDIRRISQPFFNHLLYISQYRELDGSHLATTMYVLEKSLNKKNP